MHRNLLHTMTLMTMHSCAKSSGYKFLWCFYKTLVL